MAANRFIPLISSQSGAVPAVSGLFPGELAINIADGRLFTRSGSTILHLNDTRLPAGTVSSSTQATGWTVLSSSYAATASYVPGAASDWATLANKPADLVSSSTQVKVFLPAGTVSSSEQYPGWVTASSQIDYNSIQNKLSGVISSSTQFNALTNTSASYALTASFVPGAASDWNSVANKPADLVSSSTQVKAFLPDGTVSASSQIDYNSITNKLSDVVSSSTQLQPLLPVGTVSSSAQYPGWVTGSAQIDITATTGYSTFSSSLSAVDAGQNVRIDNLSSATSSYALQSQLAGVASSNAQVKTYLPDGTVSSSAQVALNSITGTTFATANFTFPQNLTVGGTLTAQEIQTEYVTSSIIYESGSTKFGDTADDTHQFTGSLTVLGSISGALVLPSGIVTASSQIDYNSITNKLSGVVSSSTQVQPLLPNGTVSSSAQFPGWVTSSAQIDYNNIQNKLSGVVSSSGQVQPLLPGGTVSSSTQYPGWVTASSQIDYNSITNKLSGVVSTSAQVQPLLPGGTVSSSAQYAGWVTSSTQIVVQNTTGIGTSATTGSNTFVGNQVISGSLTTTADTMTFNGSMAVSGALSVTGSLNTLNGGITGSLLGTSSWASNAVSASHAVTASDALNAQSGGTGAGFPFSGSAIITGSLEVVNTGSVGGITGSFKGDGSQLTNLPVATILSSSVVIDTYTFVGDGSVKNYVLSQSYDIDSLMISLDGLTQVKTTDYTISTNTLSFVDTPPSASNILVRAFLNVTQNMTGSFSGSFLGIVATASFASAINRQINGGVGITGSLDVTGPVSFSNDVFVGGYLIADKLLVSSSVIYESGSTKFGDSPDDTHQFTGSVSFSQVPNIRLQADNHLFIGDGTTTIYTLSSSYDPSILTVSVDGMLNALTSDYSVSTNQLTFVSAPPSESNVFVKGLRIILS